MITKNNFLQNVLFILAVVSLVNCAPAQTCPVIGASKLNRLRPAASTCGGGGGGTCNSTLAPAQVMLSVDITGNGLEYALDPTSGDLTLMCNTATAAPGPLALVNSNFLYILDVSVTPAQVFGFSIAHGGSGALTAIHGSPFPLSEGIGGFATIVPDPLGRFLFVTNQAGSDIHVLTITGGVLAEAASSPVAVQTPDHLAIRHPGTFAYVPDSTDGDIFIFSLNSAGQLISTTSSPFIISTVLDRAFFAIVHPTANFLFTANVESVASYAMNTGTGDLTLVNGTTVSTAGAQVTPENLALDGTGKFMYVTPSGDAGLNGALSTDILGYAIDTTGGGLTVVPNAPFTSASTLDVIANPLGQELYVFSAPTISTVAVAVAPIDASGN